MFSRLDLARRKTERRWEPESGARREGELRRAVEEREEQEEGREGSQGPKALSSRIIKRMRIWTELIPRVGFFFFSLKIDSSPVPYIPSTVSPSTCPSSPTPSTSPLDPLLFSFLRKRADLQKTMLSSHLILAKRPRNDETMLSWYHHSYLSMNQLI